MKISFFCSLLIREHIISSLNCICACSIVRNKAAEKAKHVHQHHHQMPQGHNTSESLDSSTGASSELQGPPAVTGGIKSNVNLAATVNAHTPTGGSSANLQELGPSTDNPVGNNEGNGNSLTSALQQAAEQRSPVSGPGPGPGSGSGPGPGPGPGSGPSASAGSGSGSGYSINGILGLQQQHSHHLQSSSNNNNSISTNNNNNNSPSETSKRKRIEIHGKYHLCTFICPSQLPSCDVSTFTR